MAALVMLFSYAALPPGRVVMAATVDALEHMMASPTETYLRAAMDCVAFTPDEMDPEEPPAPLVKPRDGAPRPNIVLLVIDDMGWANVRMDAVV